MHATTSQVNFFAGRLGSAWGFPQPPACWGPRLPQHHVPGVASSSVASCPAGDTRNFRGRLEENKAWGRGIVNSRAPPGKQSDATSPGILGSDSPARDLPLVRGCEQPEVHCTFRSLPRSP